MLFLPQLPPGLSLPIPVLNVFILYFQVSQPLLALYCRCLRMSLLCVVLIICVKKQYSSVVCVGFISKFLGSATFASLLCVSYYLGLIPVIFGGSLPLAFFSDIISSIFVFFLVACLISPFAHFRTPGFPQSVSLQLFFSGFRLLIGCFFVVYP